MKTKACSTCERDLPLDDFVKDKRKPDDRGARCKECHGDACADYVARNAETRLQSSRRYYERHADEHMARTVRWAKAHPKEVKAIKAKARANRAAQIRAYRKAHGVESQRRTRTAHPNEYRARNAVNNAIAKGRLPKAATKRCVRCGDPARQYHHHKGYERKHWLDVVPACDPCHVILG